MKNLLYISALLFSVTSFACNSLIDEKLRILDSTESESLCKYEGDVLLIVNVASKCGYTPQYEGLQKLYSEYGDKGFTVIGIPSRDFMWQEFTDDSKTAEFLSITSIKSVKIKTVIKKNPVTRYCQSYFDIELLIAIFSLVLY